MSVQSELDELRQIVSADKISNLSIRGKNRDSDHVNEYAKLISWSAYGRLQRGFITDRFKKLRDGEITIPGSIREWKHEMELPRGIVGQPPNLGR